MTQKDTLTKQSKLLKFFIRTLIGLIILLSIAVYAVFVFQDKLIFYPQTISEETLNHISQYKNGIKEINITTKDGTQLGGWHVSENKDNLLIYFGGNAEEVSKNIDAVELFEGWSVVLMHYRGYGTSKGNPGEINFYNDALEVYDYLTSIEDKAYSKIVVMGRSIGTGVATYLAYERNVDGVVLVTPYDSLSSVAEKKVPFLPVGILLKHKFDSVSRASKITVPVLMLVAAEDKTIPPFHAEKLAKEWAGQVTMEVFKGEGHNSISKNEAYWTTIGDFLDMF